MVTAEERKQAFLADFTALLRRHNADFGVGSEHPEFGRGKGYAEIEMHSLVYADGTKKTHEYACFLLPESIRLPLEGSR